jgi:hypothetical protein
LRIHAFPNGVLGPRLVPGLVYDRAPNRRDDRYSLDHE